AIQDFTDLGSGYTIALRDLEIRGAGNLLGKEQSGFVQSIGFDLYCKILDEAVAELKGSINLEEQNAQGNGYKKLTEKEEELIREHVRWGARILEPIAAFTEIIPIVLQHHERLDGSGYPQALSGDNIVQDARILCVADVVESMSSHRPYRPGRGLDAALDEIRRNRGVLYDPQAVDACLELFLNKRYQLPEH
ncbi:MAG: HD domain-containing phosphohydrolase, partial [Acidihalobacter sp.]